MSSLAAQAYQRVVRPLLFQLEPENAHRLGLFALSAEWPWRLLSAGQSDPRLRIQAGPWMLDSPIGLGAGLDKDGNGVPGLQHLGFDYVCVGSILMAPCKGNPRPRLLRYPEVEGLVNCYGMPSDGLEVCVARFKQLKARGLHTRLIANVHADMVEDYCRMVGAFADCADGVELGLRCPNTASRVSIYPIPKLDELLGAIRQQNAATPIFVKLPPYADAQEKENRLELVERVIHFGCAGVTVPGNWPVEDKRLSKGRGSISGPSVFANNLEVVRAVAGVARGRIAIKATGGISTGADAFQMLAAGATMLDLFSVFVYRGWAAAELIKSELLALMDAQGFANIAELQASGAAKAAQLDRREGFAQAPTRAAS